MSKDNTLVASIYICRVLEIVATNYNKAMHKRPIPTSYTTLKKHQLNGNILEGGVITFVIKGRVKCTIILKKKTSGFIK